MELLKKSKYSCFRRNQVVFLIKKRSFLFSFLLINFLFISSISPHPGFVSYEYALPELKKVLGSENLPMEKPPVTPHFDFAYPSSYGTLKGIFIVPFDSIREVVELAQRTDIEAYVFPFMEEREFTRYRIISSKIGEDKFLPDYGKEVFSVPHDFIFLAHLPSNSFKKEFYQNLIDEVKSGKGLVCIPSKDNINSLFPVTISLQSENSSVWKIEKEHFITRGIPWDILPEVRVPIIKKTEGDILVKGADNIPLIITSNYNNGRMVFLNTDISHILPNPELLIHKKSVNRYWEWYYLILWRAIEWVSKREPEVKITSIFPDGKVIKREEWKLCEIKNNMTYYLKKEPVIEIINSEIFEGIIEIELFNKYGEKILSKEIEGNKNKILQTEIPKFIPSGRYFIKVILRDKDKKIIDQAGASFSVISNLRLEKIEPDKNFYLQGEEANIEIEINSFSSKEVPAKIFFKTVDTYGRETFYEEKDIILNPYEEKNIKLRLKPKDTLSTCQYLYVEIKDKNGNTICSDRKVLFYPRSFKIAYSDYLMGLWTSLPASYLVDFYYHRLKEFGFNLHPLNWLREEVVEIATENNFFVTVENLWYLNSWEEVYPEGVRKPCLSDPSVIISEKERVQRIIKNLLKYGISGYAISEEMALSKSLPETEVCFGPHCRRNFIKWLEKRYEKIEKLNEEWETSYKSWEEIKQIGWMEIKNQKNFVPWIDFRMFMEDVWCGTMKNFKEWVNEIHPEVPAGYNCGDYSDNAFNGYNRFKLGKYVDYSIEYLFPFLETEGDGRENPLNFEVLSSSMGEKAHLLTPIGYRYNMAIYTYRPYYIMLNRGCGITFYSGAEGTNTDYQIFPDWSRTKRTEEIERGTKDLREGLGKLIINSERENYGIGVFLNHSSVFRATAEELSAEQNIFNDQSLKNSYKFYLKSRFNIHRLIQGAGFQYDFIDGDLTEEELKKIKVLIIPYGLCLSDETIKNLTQFCKKGGKIISCLRTGVCDEHGKLIDRNNEIEKLFGFKREGRMHSFNKEEITIKESIGVFSPGDKIKVEGKEKISLSEGKAFAIYYDGTPAIIRNNCGNGEVWYLNCLPDFDEKGVQLLKAILKECGISSGFELKTDEKPPIIKQTLLKKGDLKYLALQKPGGYNSKINSYRIEFEKPYYIYNVRENEFLGKKKELDLNISEYQTLFLALYPYKIESVMIKGEKKAKRGKGWRFQIKIEVSNKNSGDHILNLKVYDSKENLREDYSKNIIAEKGLYKGEIPFANNDPKGKWQIFVKEVVSGKTDKFELEVF